MSRYIPMPAYYDAMPVDISFVFEDEKPAGKHGFLKVDGENMRFEDGTLGKFWGVNFNGGANFPEHDYAEKVARRLAQAGCNIVRFHQLDAEWDTPNIFSYSKGKRVKTTRELDPKSMDRLDYLIHCLKEEGIYCYMDMMTYRKFKEGDDVPFHKDLMDSAKPWSITNPRMIELQKEFASQFWNHYNPYTKLCHKDDPVFVMAEITNECDLFRNSDVGRWAYKPIPYYENEFRGMFRDWLQENGIEYDWENCPISSNDDPMLQFKMYATKKYYKEMSDYLKNECGVKFPITGTNWYYNTALNKSHEDMDFCDTHHYYYDWRWGNTERTCKHMQLTESLVTFPNAAKMRIAGKPFFISEWDMPWPNSYRAEAPIYYAAIGALQNWSGFAIHTYSYGTRLEDMKILGSELSSPVGGVPYREGIFSVWNDPAKFGLFYHSALIFRRGDIAPANKKIAVNAPILAHNTMTAFAYGMDRHQMSTVFDNKLPEGYDELMQDTETLPPEKAGLFVSDNGHHTKNINAKIGMVDSPRSKVIYGQISRNRSPQSTNKWNPAPLDVPSGGLIIDSYTDFGVIAVSSLTNEPTETSDNMLLSAIGRARNTDAQFDGTKMLNIGKPPILAEVIHAHVKLKTELGDDLKVWGVNAEGFYAAQLPTTYEDGYLCFEIGDEMNPACYYLIVKE